MKDYIVNIQQYIFIYVHSLLDQGWQTGFP